MINSLILFSSIAWKPWAFVLYFIVLIVISVLITFGLFFLLVKLHQRRVEKKNENNSNFELNMGKGTLLVKPKDKGKNSAAKTEQYYDDIISNVYEANEKRREKLEKKRQASNVEPIMANESYGNRVRRRLHKLDKKIIKLKRHKDVVDNRILSYRTGIEVK